MKKGHPLLELAEIARLSAVSAARSAPPAIGPTSSSTT